MAKPAPPQREPRSFIEEICERVSNGETLLEVCADLRDFGGPPPSTFRLWVMGDDALAAKYARAKELQLEHWGDLIRVKSAKSQLGEVTEVDGEGKIIKVKTGDTVDRSRLEIDSMKWLLSKLAPKKYGERTQHEVTGAEGGPLVIRWADSPKPNPGA